MGTTRLQVIQLMADAMARRFSGTLTSAQGSDTSGFTDNVRRYEPDDFCNGGMILTTGGTGSGIERRISDFASSTSTGSIFGTWGAALDTTTTYDIFLPPFTLDAYRAAIKATRNKLAARGIGRRPIDASLVSAHSQVYALPAGIDFQLAEVWIQNGELIGNRDWSEEDSGWTLHANASLTNDGANGERTIKLIATAAGEETTIEEIGVSPGSELEFFAAVKGTGTVAGRWRYRFLDSGGSVIVGPTTIGTQVSADSFTLQSGAIVVPVNAVELRLSFDAPAAGTVYTQAPNLMRRGDWARISRFGVEYDGSTGYLRLDGVPSSGRRIKLVGRQTLESLAADSGTLSLDEPEIAVFVEMALEELWRGYGARAGLEASEVDREVSKHKRNWEELIGSLGAEWRVRRTVRTPMFGAGH